jgi:Tol biopolymer transport system component
MEPAVSDPQHQFATALADRYQLERELGRGGMATVFLAHDRKHDRPVALKVLHPELAATLGPERFLREIKVAARLQHPHILPVYDSGESAGWLWFTMPYVDGESLRDRLRRTQRLPLDEALRITREVAQGLQYAHQQDVVHRDIKPENILLTRDGSTLIADFGVARTLGGAATDRLTMAGMVVGTPTYMSPEQATGDAAIDGRSDVYALGCVLQEMLTGKPPFQGSTPQSVIAQHLTVPPPSVLAFDSTLPASVAQALHKALAKNPLDRFDSAAAFGAALGSEEGSRAPGVGGRWIAAAVLAAALLLALTFYAGHRIAPSPRSASGAIASGFNRKLTQLTFGEGVEEWAAWSPDGARLAYVGEVDSVRRLFVRTLATGAERRLSTEAKDDIQPAWSPDGRRLVFVRARAAGGKLEPNDINGWYEEGGDVWSVELLTGRETRLVENAFNPAYSPDGSRLAFDASWAGARRIWTADSSGRNPRQVTSDSSEAVVHTGPRWSPDGSRLVFRRIEKIKSDIVVVELASQGLTRITDDNVLDMDPVWSRDQREIYFASSRGGGLNLWRVPVDPGGHPAGPPAQLTTGAGDDIEPTLSPDGQRLAFAVRGINSDLWRLPVSPATGQVTGAPRSVVATTRVESRGAWSPDGRTIAFNSDRLGEMNIWLHGTADSMERQLTRGPGGDYQPAWSPDGRGIAFFSARAGNADIWTVRVEDGRLTRLTSDPSTDTNPFYSPDGRQLAFLSDRDGRTEVWLMQADGSGQRRLTSTGAGGHFLRWTPDGREIVYRAESGTQVQIFRVSVGDGSVSRLPDVASGAHMSFSPDRSLILDVRGHKSLWVYPVNGQAARQVFAFSDPDTRIDYPTWSPDGGWVLFDRATPHGGDLWLLEKAE